MLAAAVSYVLGLLPVDLAYWHFVLMVLLNGIGMGLFTCPNRGRHHEQPAARSARRRSGHAPGTIASAPPRPSAGLGSGVPAR